MNKKINTSIQSINQSINWLKKWLTHACYFLQDIELMWDMSQYRKRKKYIYIKTKNQSNRLSSKTNYKANKNLYVNSKIKIISYILWSHKPSLENPWKYWNTWQ